MPNAKSCPMFSIRPMSQISPRCGAYVRDFASSTTYQTDSWLLDQEVEGYYDLGLRVPDDVTLLWTDDTYVSLL